MFKSCYEVRTSFLNLFFSNTILADSQNDLFTEKLDMYTFENIRSEMFTPNNSEKFFVSKRIKLYDEKTLVTFIFCAAGKV